MIYKLNDLYSANTLISDVTTSFNSLPLSAFKMGMNTTDLNEVLGFVCSVSFGYFFDEYVAYDGDDTTEVMDKFIDRFCYDIGVRLAYWYRKYNYIKELLTNDDFNLLQTSKMTSSSTDTTKTAGGSLQKIATTPTGVSTGTSDDEIDITIGTTGNNTIGTDGFADKYSNTQQKYANANQVEGSRSGEIFREGSVDDLLKILEKLPSSFANEITEMLQKHFIFDYDGLEKGYYTDD